MLTDPLFLARSPSWPGIINQTEPNAAEHEQFPLRADKDRDVTHSFATGALGGKKTICATTLLNWLRSRYFE